LPTASVPERWPFPPQRVWDLGSHAQRLARSLHSGPVAGRLREAIISGALPAGTPLVERSLAEQLSVSRGPVRNAVFALEGEGLVSTHANGRAVVRGFDQADLDDLMAVRFELESRGVRWGIERGQSFESLIAVFEEMKSEGTSNENLVNLDLSFHLALVESSGSRFLVQAWQAIAPVLHTVITLGNRSLAQHDPTWNFERIIDAHQRLVDPIVAGEADRAVEGLAEQFSLTTNMFARRNDDPASISGTP
jgi:DNA-binding GntR family transcriptional regulator